MKSQNIFLLNLQSISYTLPHQESNFSFSSFLFELREIPLNHHYLHSALILGDLHTMSGSNSLER